MIERDSILQKLIVNADDFGYRPAVNAGILKAFSENLCSSTTIMANGQAFEEACEQIHSHNLNSRVGIHIVLTEGFPLTDAIKSCPQFCDREGRFRTDNRKKYFFLSESEKQQIGKEIAAQIERCRRNGLWLTHLDSHHHVHTEWALGVLILRIAKEYRIPYVRLCRSSDPGSRWYKNLYRKMLNHYIRHSGAAGTHFFGTPEDYKRFSGHHISRDSKTPLAEIMIHPALDEKGRLIDTVTQRDLRVALEPLRNRTELISYGHLKKRADEQSKEK